MDPKRPHPPYAPKMEELAATTADSAEAQSPEIVIGLVAPYGTPLTYFTTTLSGTMKSKCGYSTELLRLSDYTKLFAGLSEPYPSNDASEAARVAALMTRGDQARKLADSADVLASKGSSMLSRIPKAFLPDCTTTRSVLIAEKQTR